MPYFLVSFGISILAVPVFREVSRKAGVLDCRTGGTGGMVPRLGGPGIFCAFLLPALYLLTAQADMAKYLAIIISATVVFAGGVYDDIKGLSVWKKLFLETMAALFAYSEGLRIIMPLDGLKGLFATGLLSLPVTVLWILIVTNSMNLVDGLDGLAAGTGIMASVALFLYGGLGAYGQLACLLLTGSLAGFLVYNLPAASVFMGDSGSLFTGFVLACLSVTSLAKSAAGGINIAPVAVFGIPLMDMLYAVLRRYYRGLPLGMADREHIHHKLLQKGLPARKALFVLYALDLVLVSSCLFLARASGLWSVFAVLTVAALIGLRGFGYVKFLPLAKELIKNKMQRRKRRFCNYAIRKFRTSSSGAHSMDSFADGIKRLAVSVHFREMEIELYAPGGNIPFFLYTSAPAAGKILTLTFPLSFAQGKGKSKNKKMYSGQIRISAAALNEFMPYSAGIAQAVSEEIAMFLHANKAVLPVFKPEAGRSHGSTAETLGASS